MLRRAELFAGASVTGAGTQRSRRQRQLGPRVGAERARAINPQIAAQQLREWAARRRMTHGRDQGGQRSTGNSSFRKLELSEEGQGSRLLAELLPDCKA